MAPYGEEDAGMTEASDKTENRRREPAPKPDDRKARLAEALRANLKRRKQAGAKPDKPGSGGPETGS